MRDVFLEARCLSHMESAYRLLRFPMQYNMHTVISLSAHLPGQQPVYLKGPNAEEVTPVSKLLAYFSLVRECERAKHMTWIEVAEQFWFTGKEYKPFKKSGRRIATLWPVNPKMSELYALRKLLYNVRGASSYEYLRTVNGITYDSFMGAAEAAGYVVTETEWEKCLESASAVAMPSDIRRLYAQILLYCRPTNPVYLWNLYKFSMRTRRRNPNESESSLDMRSLTYIETILKNNGASLEDCGLKSIKDALSSESGVELDGKASPGVPERTVNVADSLTPAQERIVNAIMAESKIPKGNGNKLYYIDGKAGS
ncbi:unnamed protein product, partial [Cylicostephanus goldi]